MDVGIDKEIDKPIYYKKLTNDKIINLTGESGSGKSTIANQFLNNDDYIVIDYDLLLNPPINSYEFQIKKAIEETFGTQFITKLIESENLLEKQEKFTLLYEYIVKYFSNTDKTIILNGSQMRYIANQSIIKGTVIALRPSLSTCVERAADRKRKNNPNITQEQLELFKQHKKEELETINPLLNTVLEGIDRRNPDNKFDLKKMQNHLENKALLYIQIIYKEYGKFLNITQIEILQNLIQNKNFIVVESSYKFEDIQAENIINNPELNEKEKFDKLVSIEATLAHGGRVFEDNKIHFYPNSTNFHTEAEALQACDEILIHELLHFFIRPKYTDKINNINIRINSDTTEALVDMIARDINQKYGLFPQYNSNYGRNVIFIREALENIAENERLLTIFNDDIETIYKKMSNNNYNAYAKYLETLEGKSEFDLFINDLATSIFPSNLKKGVRILCNYSANYKNKTEAMEAIRKYIETNMPEKTAELETIYIKYNLAEGKTLETQPQKRVLKKPDNFGFLNTSIIIVGTILIILITAFITFLAIK